MHVGGVRLRVYRAMLRTLGKTDYMTDENGESRLVAGQVKWFDPAKGFGFVVPDEGGPDILLHANVLRNFGQSSVADGARISLRAQRTTRGEQAIEIVDIEPPVDDGLIPLEDIPAETAMQIETIEMQPGRVKWFDKGKGFGFANIFGFSEDIFIHIEVLRRSGLADLQPGEAVALRVIEGRRGRMAAQVLAWDMAVNKVETP